MSGKVDAGTVQAHIGLDTKDLRKGAAETKGILGGLEGQFHHMKAAVAGLAAGFAVVEMFKEFTRDGMELAHTMATVGGVFRSTAEELKLVTEETVRMSEKSSQAAQQIGRGFYYLASAGFSVTEAIEAMPTVLNLAKIGEMDIARASDVAVNAMRGMGMEAKDLSRMADTMVGTFTRMNSTLDTLAESYTYVIPTAHAMNYTFEETNAMLGLLSNAGIKGSSAGAGLSQAMIKANQIAGKLGFTSSDLVDVLAEMAAKGYNTTDVIKMFGVRAARVALVLQQAGTEVRAFQNKLQTVGGETEILGGRMSATFKSSFGRLKNMWKSIGEGVYQNYEQRLLDAMETTWKFLKDNEVAIKQFLTVIMTVLTEVINVVAELAQGLAELATVAGRSIGTIPPYFKELAKEVEKTGETVTETSEEIAAGFHPPPMGEWDKTWIQIKTFFGNMIKGIVAAAKAALSVIMLVVKTLVYLLLPLWEGIVGIGEAWAKLQKGDFKGAQESMGAFSRALKDMGPNLKNTWDSFINQMAETQATVQVSVEVRNPDEIWKSMKATPVRAQFWDVARKENEDFYDGLVQESEWVNGELKKIEKSTSAEDKARTKDLLDYKKLLWEGFSRTREDLLAKEVKGAQRLQAPPSEVATFRRLSALQTAEMAKLYKGGSDYSKPYVAGKGLPLGELDEEEEADKAEKAAAKIQKAEEKVQADRIGALKELLSSTVLTTEELQGVWENYYMAQSREIFKQRKEFIEGGGSETVATLRARQAFDDLLKEKPGFTPAKTAKEIEEEKKKAREIAGNVLDAQVYAYAEMLNSTALTTDEMGKVWENYKVLRLRQIDDELSAKVAANELTQEQADQVKKVRLRELDDENVQARQRRESWVQIADEGFQSIADATAGFMETQKGEWASFHASLRDMLKSFISSVLKNLLDAQSTDSAGKEAAGWIAKGAGWVKGLLGGGGGSNVSPNATGMTDLNTSGEGYAVGGIFDHPRRALFAEHGPEAVIPLSKFRDPAFMDRLNGGAAGGAAGGRPVVVNIQTPDVGSFRSSSSQVAARMALAVQLANRRS